MKGLIRGKTFHIHGINSYLSSLRGNSASATGNRAVYVKWIDKPCLPY